MARCGAPWGQQLPCPPCNCTTEVSEKGCRLPVPEVPSSCQLPPPGQGLPAQRPTTVQLWLCHQLPHCLAAVMSL